MSKTREKQAKNIQKKVGSYFYQKWWFWVIIAVMFIGSWLSLFIKDINLRSSIIGIWGVWGSSIATIFIGIIAARQTIFFNKENEKAFRAVDMFLEKIEIGNYSLPVNKLGIMFTNENCGKMVSMRLYNYMDNPIFSIGIKNCIINEKNVLYNLTANQVDDYGKLTLCKNEMMYIIAGIPKSIDSGNCEIVLAFENQYGDKFTKEIKFNISGDYCVNIKQGKTLLKG